MSGAFVESPLKMAPIKSDKTLNTISCRGYYTTVHIKNVIGGCQLPRSWPNNRSRLNNITSHKNIEITEGFYDFSVDVGLIQLPHFRRQI